MRSQLCTAALRAMLQQPCQAFLFQQGTARVQGPAVMNRAPSSPDALDPEDSAFIVPAASSNPDLVPCSLLLVHGWLLVLKDHYLIGALEVQGEL